MIGPKIPELLDEMKQKWPRLAPKYLSGSITATEDAGERDEEEENCQFCDKTKAIKRTPRDMRVHYGLIASGNQVIKDATLRDRLNKDLDSHVLCVETEAAGLMDNFPCIVIRGICDYADSHKNKDWQEHAAAVAAAFAKELLGYVQPSDIEGESTVKDVLGQVFDAVSKTGVDIAEIKPIMGEDEGVKILNWFTPIDYGSQQSDFLEHDVKEVEHGYWIRLNLGNGSIKGKNFFLLRRERTRLSFAQASKVLESVATLYSRTFIIVDALDECDNSDGSISLDIRARDKDVTRFLDDHMSHLPSFVSEDPGLKDRLKMGIVKAVDGMFLLAKFHLHSLVDKISVTEIELALEMLPKGTDTDAYNQAYEEAMKRIQDQQKGFRNLAMRVLSWITRTMRPLLTRELQHALAVKSSASTLDLRNFTEIGLIISVCAGLVTVDSESDIVRLVHYSTQQYFDRTWATWFPDAHTETRRCLISCNNALASSHLPITSILFSYAVARGKKEDTLVGDSEATASRGNEQMP
ncbi:hypothetical protein GQ43DRAFT_435056 [Delitschia confertaspora ATCC 74209]|uniref:GPI inositol-deacylase winged helix domain-containing protein n=1 Tax=Delitschia confertaspora ATCC 74209 TaxID=1513339 RepID=A0A9P4JDT0_9PLEO|nr:hypothetical protein GQ43DRAFT_435056 [Delitschia confertaspora ATCC 74209]